MRIVIIIMIIIKLVIFSLSVCPDVRHYQRGDTGPGHAEGELSTLPDSVPCLRQQHLSVPWLTQGIAWQRLRLAHRDGAQAFVQHLLQHHAARCPEGRLSLLHTEKLSLCPAQDGLSQLPHWQRQPYNLALLRPCGVTPERGGRGRRTGVQLIPGQVRYDGGATALRLYAAQDAAARRL